MNKILAILFLLPSIAFAEGNYYGGAKDFTQDPDCVGAWAMTYDELTEQDMTTNNEDLTQYSTAAIPTSSDVPTGYSGTSRFFVSGSDPRQYIYHSDGGSTDIATGASTSLSIVAWFKTVDNGSDQVIVAKGTYAGTDGSYFLRYDTGDAKFVAGITSDATPTWAIAKSSSDAADNTWVHVALVYNDGTSSMQVYFDGVANGDSVSYSDGIFNNTGVFRVGSFGGSADMDGYLKDVAVFKRALSPAEVVAIKTFGLRGNNS